MERMTLCDVAFLRSPSSQCWWPLEGVDQHSVRFAADVYKGEYFAQLGIHWAEELRNATDKRRAEFLAGRYCAALLLSGRGLPAHVPIGRHRCPVWPAGVVGAISHTVSLAVAVIADETKFAGLGIDIESVMPTEVAAELCAQVLNPAERAWLEHPWLSPAEITTLVFSAKESLFKALYPSVNEYFGFDAATMTALDVQRGALRLRLETTLGGGRWLAGAEFDVLFVRFAKREIATLVALPQLPPRSGDR
ncbi:4'-phosphopantetheinyl transferase superfamily protein [Stenotrophomonas forensis]|uniref:4'-phosphopantetheinyl transferase family protein n=1 Tax=Stenotrophomonas forensis TaxID=2871169 RepID=UPI0018D4B08E|nr:4'-phosphopantetheinyl transferase superfamily protein [Stenotrophomonas maltophilia]MBH1599159.1 4'-phosphopantetheinyl transferase superfamily protein [Stenotrophomonas maltophilia]